MTGRANVNRRRILDVALAELLRDPEASMDQIARAAGVVRRTVYGHFPSRDALVAALVDDAAETVGAARAEALRAVGDPGDAAEALARAILAVWEIADGYRLLVSMAQRSVTVEGILRRLEPVRRESEALLRRGLEAGRFTSVLPAAALSYVHEQILFGLLQAVNDGLLPPEDAGHSAAVTVLTAAGVRAEEAAELVARIGTARADGREAEAI